MLTMLGVIFGVAAVIAMVSIGEGAKQEALDQIKKMGINVVHVKRATVAGELLEKSQDRSPHGLKYSDAFGLAEVCDFADQIVPVREVVADVKIGDTPVSLKVVGTTPGYAVVTRTATEYGRFLNAGDVSEHKAVCVLGAAAKRELFGFDDAIGKNVKVGKRLFRVIGCLEPKEIGSAKAFSALRDLNSDIYIPVTVALSDFQIYSQQTVPTTTRSWMEMRQRMQSRQSIGNSPISEIIVQVENEDAAIETASVVKQVLRRQHKGIRDYEIVIPVELLRQSQQTQRIFNIVMAAIASISLLVGGIGIMNIMLATVSHRTREIGIRRCIGATRWDIVRQFMIEALVITCTGGLIGIAIGVGGARAISDFAQWRTVVSVQAVIVSFGVSALVGVVFGIYPAVRAAMIDPIEALRYS
jgi:putative ABC transport system permease protein